MQRIAVLVSIAVVLFAPLSLAQEDPSLLHILSEMLQLSTGDNQFSRNQVFPMLQLKDMLNLLHEEGSFSWQDNFPDVSLPGEMQQINTGNVAEPEDTAMLQILDGMQQFMTGELEFDRDYYTQLRACMDAFDPLLTAAQDASWQGIINYWLMNGTGTDFWGKNTLAYVEHNATNSEFLNMTIYEPCNYASNVAYYHDATEICNRKTLGSPFVMPQEYVDSLGMAYSFMAMGSSLMHMSHTDLGHQQDTRGIRLVSYLIHQGSLAGLENASSIITDFSLEPRNRTALQYTQDFFDMYLNLPVEEWYDHTNAIDIPDYYLSFAGIFSTVLTIAFEPDVVDHYFPILSGYFGLSDDDVNFILNDYLPELRNLTGPIDLGLIQETRFVENTVSSVIKLIYAFLWQEEILADNPMFLNETVNRRGWELLPEVNHFANVLNKFEYFEADFQNGTNTYPGGDWCNPVLPHAKWHLESGIGLLDLTYVGDEMYRLLSSLK